MIGDWCCRTSWDSHWEAPKPNRVNRKDQDQNWLLDFFTFLEADLASWLNMTVFASFVVAMAIIGVSSENLGRSNILIDPTAGCLGGPALALSWPLWNMIHAMPSARERWLGTDKDGKELCSLTRADIGGSTLSANSTRGTWRRNKWTNAEMTDPTPNFVHGISPRLPCVLKVFNGCSEVCSLPAKASGPVLTSVV